jgi:hypothetical protein
MTATRKKHASSTWSAILAGCEALQHGLIRRVNNGETTEIWGHKWIADHFGGRPITPRDGHDLQYVSELLTGSGSWNVQVIRNMFQPIDAEAILRQPIERRDHDFWALL